MLEKGSLGRNTGRAAHVNTEHIITQADDIRSLPEVPKCSGEFLLCILFLLLLSLMAANHEVFQL